MNTCTLTRTFAAVALFAAAAAMTTTALAQDDNTPRSRADVNAETLAAMKAGELVAGEGMPTMKSPTAASTKTREARRTGALGHRDLPRQHLAADRHGPLDPDACRAQGRNDGRHQAQADDAGRRSRLRLRMQARRPGSPSAPPPARCSRPARASHSFTLRDGKDVRDAAVPRVVSATGRQWPTTTETSSWA